MPYVDSIFIKKNHHIFVFIVDSSVTKILRQTQRDEYKCQINFNPDPKLYRPRIFPKYPDPTEISGFRSVSSENWIRSSKYLPQCIRRSGRAHCRREASSRTESQSCLHQKSTSWFHRCAPLNEKPSHRQKSELTKLILWMKWVCSTDSSTWRQGAHYYQG